MSVTFEVFRQSDWTLGHPIAPNPPCEGAAFNSEENRWEITLDEDTALAYFRGIAQKHDANLKLVFPPYKTIKDNVIPFRVTDLPILEILDCEDGEE